MAAFCQSCIGRALTLTQLSIAFLVVSLVAAMAMAIGEVMAKFRTAASERAAADAQAKTVRRTRHLAALLALLAPALPVHAQNTANQVPQAQRDAVLGGNMVFQSNEGGPFVTQNFSVYRLRYLLTKDHEPLYFSYRVNGTNVTYRVAWMAEPSFAYRNLTGGIPIPIPPFFQQYRSDVFAMGVAMGQSEGNNLPSTTSWLPIAQLKLRSQP